MVLMKCQMIKSTAHMISKFFGVSSLMFGDIYLYDSQIIVDAISWVIIFDGNMEEPSVTNKKCSDHRK